jgi:hypothetical protein
MCQQVQCTRCGRPTFAGCGRHVEQALRDVPPEQRCRCGERKAAEPAQPRPSWLRVFKRS